MKSNQTDEIKFPLATFRSGQMVYQNEKPQKWL